ncbi:eukaryotic translation initiation factor 5B-like [Salvia splendens]|uniref:eukaryotic translation initiation factor 5B-like n=1 Tax=Salvia splendens TaxID=180675 RepID=UPI001C271D32|nr:eukaryotic translation initiation factor 5B-like [Salvia splendens]
MGHVDAGKTNFLGCISGTHGEAGIGATYLPAENIRERTKADAKLNVPGFLVIDISGHDSFTNTRGPVVTSIRALLTPHPMRELEEKLRTYVPCKEIKAAQCIKIAAQGLEHAIAGASLYVVRPNDDIEVIKKSAMEYVDSVMSRIDKSGEWVYVQASTIWSVEALLDFLKTPKVNIPVSRISIGAVQKMDVMKVSARKKEYATILAYDVEITPELAQQFGVKIFTSNIIEHLFDQFKAHMDNFKAERKRQAPQAAVFPCVLKIMPNRTFNTKDPIVLSVHVVEGIARIGTPICVPGKEFVEIGSIVYIQDDDHRVVDYAKKGERVTINILGRFVHKMLFTFSLSILEQTNHNQRRHSPPQTLADSRSLSTVSTSAHNSDTV